MVTALKLGIATAFILGVFASLWFASAACTVHADGMTALPVCAGTVAAPVSPHLALGGSACAAGASCISPAAMAGDHLQAWKGQWQNIVVPVLLLGALLLALVAFRAFRHVSGNRLALWLGVRPQLQPVIAPSANMKFWDVLRFAYADGTVQQGSRNQ
jgi:hypothetical protein